MEHRLIEIGDMELDLERKLTITRDEELHNQRIARHGIQPCVYSLSSREMDSLTAFCDTLLPSMELSDSIADESLFTFYRTSASMVATSEQVGGYMAEKRFDHPMLFLLRISLWMLSTWIGTFILCGRLSLSTQFPYMQSFSQVSQKKREEIFRCWSSSYFRLLRMLFHGVKFLALLIFFTQLNERNENPSWKALGYCGPDPNFLTQIQNIKKSRRGRGGGGNIDNRSKEEEDEAFGPLYRALIDPKQPKVVLAEALKRSGFPVSIRRHGRTTKTKTSSPTLTISCDVVVVGSGSGGGVVAGVLAKAGYKVLVLEKGNYFARSTLSLLEGPTMAQMYQSNGMIATDDLGVIILAGSTVGGGSTINWSASIRTPKTVIKEWCNYYELELFDSQLYREAMEVVCQRMGVQSDINEEGFNNAVLRRGCHELGYPVTDIPRNASPDHYCGWCCMGCKDGRKKGTSETWLVDAVDSGNGLILPGCNVLEVLHKRKKGRNRNTATGVIFEFDNGKEKEVYLVESKVTVVAGGALGTPTLLRRSGLKNVNIGKHLHLHPVAMAWGYFPDKPALGVWPEEHKKSYEGGIMTAMSSVVADFDGSGYGAIVQTPALHPGMFAAIMPWVSGADFKERMCKFSRTAHIFALARDKGSGEVNSLSSISYRMDQTDEENLKRGLEKSLRILAAAGAEEIGTHDHKGKRLKVKRVSSHEFERFVKECGRGLKELSGPICSAHQMGSCRMGVDANESVVNQRGETWEVEGLYLADSSVFPTALGVNPMVTIQAIAFCTAQSILEVLRRSRKKNR